MSLADKLIEIADNTPAVVEAVNSKRSYVNGGSCIRLNNVCEAEQELTIKVSSKNLWEFDNTVNFIGNGISSDGYVPYFYTDITDKPLTISYNVSLNEVNYSTTGNLVFIGVYYNDNTQSFLTIVNTNTQEGLNKLTIPINEHKGLKYLAFSTHQRFTSGIITISNIQIEASSTATNYSPYITEFNNVNVAVYGKNIIYPDCTSGTASGVSYITNENGEITLNGSTTSNYGSTIYVLGNGTASGLLNYYAKDDLILSGCPEGGSTTTYRLMARVTLPEATPTIEGGTKWSYPQDIGSGILIRKGSVIDYIYINIPSVKDSNNNETNIINNIVFKPQLEVGISKTEFEECREPQIVTADNEGYIKGLKAIYPVTTLIANDREVNIEARYFNNENNDICEKLTELSTILESGIGGKDS